MAAKNNIPMKVDLYKNTNAASRTYGQWYGRCNPRDGLNLKGFARHLSEHGKLATYEMMVLVLQNIVDCMTHLCLEGVPVKLDGLGTFYASLHTTGADSVEQFSTSENIEGVALNFRPEAAGQADEKLTSKALLDRTVFQLNDVVELIDTGRTDKRGKKIKYQKRTPVSQWGLANESGDDDDETPEP